MNLSKTVLFSAGTGPEECQWVLSHVIAQFGKEALRLGLTTNEVDRIEGRSALLTKSSVIQVTGGHSIDTLLSQWLGTIRWIGKSPFRAKHKRQNWYVGTHLLDTVIEEIRWNEIRFEFTKASGPGGQHRNKTNSAVRSIHIPSSTQAIASDQRSQHENKRIALKRLLEKIQQQADKIEHDQIQSRWHQHHELIRGNEVRCYQGAHFGLLNR